MPSTDNRRDMKTLLNAAILLLVSCTAHAQINAGTLKPEPEGKKK